MVNVDHIFAFTDPLDTRRYGSKTSELTAEIAKCDEAIRVKDPLCLRIWVL